jgi:membrane-associated phospholipid phosphatase
VATERVTSGITVGGFGRTWRRHAACAAALVTLWGAGYFLIADSLVMRQARDLATLPDGAIPFLGWTVWIYLAGLPLIAAPLFALRSEPAFHRAARGYVLVMLASFACFAAFPVSSPSLREAAIMAEPDCLTAWAVRALHSIDPPCNLFPSLHVSLSALSCWSMAETQPRLRWLFAAGLALIAVSVVTTKQHLLLDVLGGLALAWAVRAVPGRSAGTLWAARGLLTGVSALFGLLYWCAG